MKKKTKSRSIVLIAGMLIQLCAGIIYMWSVFKTPVASHLNWDASQAALTSSIMLSAFVIGIIAGGRAQDKLGPKRVALFGSILISAGMISTSFVTGQAPWLVYLTYGIIGGLGVGTVYTTTVSAIQKWYPDKRGFATGMMVSAFGFSLVIFAPLAKTLLESQGVPFTFTSIGILFLGICVLCSLLIDNPPADFAPGGAVKSTASAATQRHYTTSEMLKTRQFYLMALSMLFVLSAYFILNPLFMTLGMERGLTEDLALLGVMITGIASASGRLLFSWISDLIGRKAAIIGIMVITLCAVLTLIVAQGILYLVCIALIAFAFGGSAGVYPALTADYYGTKHMGLNYGCIMAGFGISALAFPVISNILTQNNVYTWSFLVSAAACVIALVLIILIKKPQRD